MAKRKRRSTFRDAFDAMTYLCEAIDDLSDGVASLNAKMDVLIGIMSKFWYLILVAFIVLGALAGVRIALPAP